MISLKNDYREQKNEISTRLNTSKYFWRRNEDGIHIETENQRNLPFLF